MTSEHNLLPKTLSLAVHELRTPVTVVAGYLRMLLREQGGPLSDKQRKMLEEAERSCNRIAALVSEMSDLGKLEARELTLSRHPIDLAALVAEVAADMQGGDERGVHLETRCGGEPVIVTGDRTRLTATLRALMHAVVREQSEPGVIVAQCLSTIDTTPPWAVVAVGSEPAVGGLAQSARGTPPEWDEWRGGLGLALPVARRVVQSLGGAIWSADGDHPRAGAALRLPLHT